MGLTVAHGRAEPTGSNGRAEPIGSHRRAELAESHGRAELAGSHGRAELAGSHGRTELSVSHGRAELTESHGRAELTNLHLEAQVMKYVYEFQGEAGHGYPSHPFPRGHCHPDHETHGDDTDDCSAEMAEQHAHLIGYTQSRGQAFIPGYELGEEPQLPPSAPPTDWISRPHYNLL
jgi:hypothetical protein